MCVSRRFFSFCSLRFLNELTAELNYDLMREFPGDKVVYKSIDCVLDNDNDN